MTVLPAGWELRLLGDAATLTAGKTPKALDQWLADRPRTDRTVPFYKVGDMNIDPSYMRRSRVTIAQDEVLALGLRMIPTGSTVFPKVGGAVLTNKKRLVAVSGAIDLNTMAATPNPGLHSGFLRYWLEALDLRRLVDGSVLPQLSSARMAALRIPVPPSSDQRNIVELLDDHFSRLDAADGLLTRARVRRSALVRSLLEKIVPHDAPGDWKQSRVAEAGRTQLGRARHPDWHQGPEMRPYLRVANVFEGRIDESDVMSMDFSGVFEKYRLRDGDVLLNEGQSPHLLGRPAIYRGSPSDVAFTNSLIRFQANADVMPEWALLVFRRHMHSGRFRRESRITTNIAHLSMARLRTVEFPVPPVSEQELRVTQAQTAFDGIARLDNEVDGSVRRLAALRRGLLQAAFTGRLTGKSLDMEIAEELADSQGAMA